jgi:uncharacterized Fe-S radical SAM superfamily protein PflX
MEAMEGQQMAYAILQECSIGQPKYRVEMYYDGEGKCYFCNEKAEVLHRIRHVGGLVPPLHPS